jgi:phage terminase small subunit
MLKLLFLAYILAKMTKQKSTILPRHKIFAEEYLTNDMNATRAYCKAFKVKPSKSIHTCASRLLSNAKVKAYIDNRKATIARKFNITKDDILRDLMEIKLKAEADGSYSDAIRAIENINKMLGFNAAEKIDVNVQQQKILNGEIETLNSRFKAIDAEFRPVEALPAE